MTAPQSPFAALQELQEEQREGYAQETITPTAMNTTENQNDTKPADKWAAEKAAHAQGKRIERREGNQEWQSYISPQWFDQCEYRIASDPAPAGKLSDEQLGEIGAEAAYSVGNRAGWLMCVHDGIPGQLIGFSAWRGDAPARAAFARAVREAVEKERGEEIARLTAELACLQKTYEAERNCSAERMAKIHAHEEEIRRLTARTVGQLSEITILHQLLDVEETKLATVTTERDRLLPRPMSTAPTEADADNDGRVLLLGDGNSATFAAIANWGGVHTSWRRWLPLNLAAYGIQTAKQVERERFENAWREYCPTDHFTVDEKAAAWHMWQAARAVKEGE